MRGREKRGREAEDGGGEKRRGGSISSVSLLRLLQGRRRGGENGASRGGMSGVSDETQSKNPQQQHGRGLLGNEKQKQEWDEENLDLQAAVF